MKTYKVITTVDIEEMQLDIAGSVVKIIVPAGTVINQIMWDGVAEFTPPLNTVLEKVV